jgi:hypothetical protein
MYPYRTKLSAKAPRFVPVFVAPGPSDHVRAAAAAAATAATLVPDSFTTQRSAFEAPCFVLAPPSDVFYIQPEHCLGDQQGEGLAEKEFIKQSSTEQGCKQCKMRKRRGVENTDRDWALSSELKRKLMCFVKTNALDDEAAEDLSTSPPEILEQVLAKGDVVQANNPSAMLSVRINQAWRKWKGDRKQAQSRSLTGAAEGKQAEDEHEQIRLTMKDGISREHSASIDASTCASPTFSDVEPDFGTDGVCLMPMGMAFSESEEDAFTKQDGAEKLHGLLYMQTSSEDNCGSDTAQLGNDHNATTQPLDPSKPSSKISVEPQPEALIGDTIAAKTLKTCT